MRRVAHVVTSAANPTSPLADTWVSVALTLSGPQGAGRAAGSRSTASRGSSGRAWRRARKSWATRARARPSTGRNRSEPVTSTWCSSLSRLTRRGSRRPSSAPGRPIASCPGSTAIWRQDCHALPTEKEPFGFRDGISHPAIEGSGIPGTNPQEQPLKAGEFVLGYPDEMGGIQTTVPDVLGRNGTYVVFRKLHQRVAEFRRYLKTNSNGPGDEELLAAKMMGRWRSGAPLALCPLHDDPALGADPHRNNDFLFQADDPTGLQDARRLAHPADQPARRAVAGVARIHRMIRRGTAYGPPLPEGVLEDDGADRGLMFAFVGAHLGRQFEFVQSEWINDGVFFGAATPRIRSPDPTAKTAVLQSHAGRSAGACSGLPRFVVTRGGEYCFMPGLRALRWLADLRT